MYVLLLLSILYIAVVIKNKNKINKFIAFQLQIDQPISKAQVGEEAHKILGPT